MGVRQKRRERRKKAEEEVREKLLEVYAYVEAHKVRFADRITLGELYDLTLERVSDDTKFRFKDVVKYEIMDMYRKYKDFDKQQK